MHGKCHPVWASILWAVLFFGEFSSAFASGPSLLEELAKAKDAATREKVMQDHRTHIPKADYPPTAVQRDRLIRTFILTSNPAVVEKLGSELIVGLAEKVRGEFATSNSMMGSSETLTELLKWVELSPDVESIGWSALLDGLNAKYVGLRTDTIGHIRYLGRLPEVSERLLPMIDDPDQSVRIDALNALADAGPPEWSAVIAQRLQKRAQGMTAEEVRMDASFEIGRSAIEKLRARAKNPEPPPRAPGLPKLKFASMTATGASLTLPTASLSVTPSPTLVPASSLATPASIARPSPVEPARMGEQASADRSDSWLWIAAALAAVVIAGFFIVSMPMRRR